MSAAPSTPEAAKQSPASSNKRRHSDDEEHTPSASRSDLPTTSHSRSSTAPAPSTVFLASDSGILESSSPIILRSLYYLSHHRLTQNAMNDLLKDLRGTGPTYEAKFRMKQLRTWSTQTQTKIITTYILVSAKRIYREHLAQTPPVDLTQSTADELGQVWTAEWRKDPKGTAMEMWATLNLEGVIDFDIMFDPPNDLSTEHRKLLRRWRNHFFNIYVTAMIDAVQIRIAHEGDRDKDKEALEHWRQYSSSTVVFKHFPEMENLPVRAAVVTGRQSKRPRLDADGNSKTKED